MKKFIDMLRGKNQAKKSSEQEYYDSMIPDDVFNEFTKALKKETPKREAWSIALHKDGVRIRDNYGDIWIWNTTKKTLTLLNIRN